MPWLPNCCISDEIATKMKNTVKLYYNKLVTVNQQGKQVNTYSGNLVLTKRCYIKDRSITAQDTAVNNGIQNAETAKELIFKNFNVTGYKFNEIYWSGVKFKVLSVNKMSRVTIEGKTYEATDARPFISILVGIKEI